MRAKVLGCGGGRGFTRGWRWGARRCLSGRAMPGAATWAGSACRRAPGALAGLYQISQPHFPGLPTLIPPLFWETSTPQAIAQAPLGVASASPLAPAATATVVPLPPWLAGHSTPTRPNEPGPTSTPSEYLSYLPGVANQPAPTRVVPLKTEPPPVPPTPRWPDGLSTQTATKRGRPGAP